MELKTILGVTFTTQYAFDKNGNRTQILYPTDDPLQRQGQANYTYDSADQNTAITAKANGVTTSVASAIAYKPFGPRTSLTFGNGLVDSRGYDSRYQLESWTLGGLLNYSHGYNNDGDLTSRTDNLNAANNRSFGYDGAHRLVQAGGPWGSGTACLGGVTYIYDKNGNRLCKGEGASATNYTITGGTNRLASSSGGELASYSYDSNGNITADGAHTYQYSSADRFATVDSSVTASYTYDGDGRRVIKRAGGATTYFFYDPYGVLITDAAPGTAAGKDYISVAGTPLARIDWATEQTLGAVLQVTSSAPNVHLDWRAFPSSFNTYVVRRKLVSNPAEKTFDGNAIIAMPVDPTQTYDDSVLSDPNLYMYRVSRRMLSESLVFYHTDHLNAPIAMTGSGATFVLRAEFRPFGGLFSQSVNTIASNLRFSRQYADGETSLHQNLFRDYASSIGRYLEPDPQQNPFAVREGRYPYAAGNPIRYVDPTGLSCGSCCDTSSKRADDKTRMIQAARQKLSVYASSHFYVPQTRCEVYANLVEEGLTSAKPSCHDFVEVFSKEQSLLAKLGIVKPPAPAHTATAVRPCNVNQWEDGFILDAWPSGNLREFQWSDWNPRLFSTYTPVIYDPAGAKIGSCDK